MAEKSWTWQISIDGLGREVSTRDVAVSTDFYGDPKDGLEQTLKKLEDRFQGALNAVEAGDNPHNHSATLATLVWTLSVRTRALRNQLQTASEQILAAMCDPKTFDEARRAGIQTARAAMDRKIDEALSKLADDKRQSAIDWLNRGGRSALRDSAERWALTVDLDSAIRRVVTEMKNEDTIGEDARTFQLNGLRKALANGTVPDDLWPTCWAVWVSEPGTFILGDSCVVARSTSGRIGVPMQFGVEEWDALYLPISSSRVLVWCQTRPPAEFDIDELNGASAQMSDSYIYASEFDDRISDLGKKIGTGNSTMTAAEIESTIVDVWKGMNA